MTNTLFISETKLKSFTDINNNVYLCNTTHTSTGSTPISSNTDVSKWDLIVDAQSAIDELNAGNSYATLKVVE